MNAPGLGLEALADPRCRYVCVFNWESIRSHESVLNALTGLVDAEDAGVRR